MIEFKVDVSEIVRMAEVMPYLAEYIGKEVDIAMKESGMMLTTLVAVQIARNSKDLGLLEAAVSWPSGFSTTGSPDGIYEGTIAASGKVTAFGTAPSVYSNYVEFGIAPTWVPIEPLEYWVIRKLGVPPAEARGIAEVVQLGIRERGIKAKENFKNAWEGGGEAKVRKIWERVPARIIKRWNDLRS